MYLFTFIMRFVQPSPFHNLFIQYNNFGQSSLIHDLCPFLFVPQAVQQQLSKKEIEDLLRRGAYGAIMDEEDEGAKFCEEDIDQILQRRTKTITIESEGRGSTFAKVNERDNR